MKKTDNMSVFFISYSADIYFPGQAADRIPEGYYLAETQRR